MIEVLFFILLTVIELARGQTSMCRVNYFLTFARERMLHLVIIIYYMVARCEPNREVEVSYFTATLI